MKGWFGGRVVLKRLEMCEGLPDPRHGHARMMRTPLTEKFETNLFKSWLRNNSTSKAQSPKSMLAREELSIVGEVHETEIRQARKRME